MFSLILWLWVRGVQQQQEEPYRCTEGLAACCSPGYHPTCHTWGFDDVSMKRSAWTITFVHILSFSCNCSRLSQQTVLPSRGWPCQSPLLAAFLWFLNNHTLHPSTIPFSRRAPALAGLDPPSPRLYSQPLKVHSLAWRHREENQTAQGGLGSQVKPSEKKKKEKKKEILM